MKRDLEDLEDDAPFDTSSFDVHFGGSIKIHGKWNGSGDTTGPIMIKDWVFHAQTQS